MGIRTGEQKETVQFLAAMEYGQVVVSPYEGHKLKLVIGWWARKVRLTFLPSEREAHLRKHYKTWTERVGNKRILYIKRIA